MGYLFLVICLGCLLSASAIWFIQLRKYGKDKKVKLLDKKVLKLLLIGWICFGVSGATFPLAAGLLSNWAFEPGRMVLACIAGLVLFASFTSLWGSFYLRFYRPDTDAKQLKIIKLFLYISIPVAIISFLTMVEAVAPYLSYPLEAGIVINDNGIHFFNGQNRYDSIHRGGLSIAWYGVFIIFGAMVCYWISDHRFYQKYGRHGILDSTLFVALPAGILGARIWYVVGNWEKDGFNTNFAKAFEIWNGGLTILGGAVAGILVGTLWFMWRRKYADIRMAWDAIIPTILLAQAIGRLGNFFNLEVFGNVVAVSDGWGWVPSWIQSQMRNFAMTSDIPSMLDPSLLNGLTLKEGYMNVPLFLIEGLCNVAGYFIITYLIPVIWRKRRAPGLNLGWYLIWYGTVRIILEPLRNVTYNMGVDNQWSIFYAAIYIGLGLLVIGLFEGYYFYRLKKGLPFEIIRGKMPKQTKPAPKKSALEKVSEAQQKTIKKEENPVETQQTETVETKKEGENDGK